MRTSFNLNLRLNSRGLSARPYVRLTNKRGGLLALFFGRRVKL